MTFSIPDAYRLTGRTRLADIDAEGISLIHKKSGARLALVPCADENKVFYITFRTPPADSTGAAHIVEHTVLCGSEKYPLRDPFVELVKGSLNTYLNATTYPDKTMYPVASTNDRDFRNLMDVYLDAVFHPKIYEKPEIFAQEGWRYTRDPKTGELGVSGVVYNEMKGAFSSPEEVLERLAFSALFPDTAYGFESGGDPDHIPELSYEAFLRFHKAYYHPSNAYLYLYGNLDMEDTLRYLDTAYLSEYDAAEIRSELTMQKPFAAPVRVAETYPVADGEEKESFLSWHAVIGDYTDLSEMIAFDAIDYALFSRPGAPVKRALLDAGIGEDSYGSVSDGLLQPYFSVVARNAEPEAEEQFLSVIRKTLTEIVKKGIDRDSLRAALRMMEFQIREADFGIFPKGLVLGIDLLDTWLYDDDRVFDLMNQTPLFAELEERLKTGWFEELVRTRLLENPHAAVVTLYAEEGKGSAKEDAMRAHLAGVLSNMSEAERDAVREGEEKLLAWQETADTPEALAAIPNLSVSDITKEVRALSNEEERLSGVPVVSHITDTRGIVYLDLYFRADDLTEEELAPVSFLRSVLLNVDTPGLAYTDLQNAIHAHTGGISCGLISLDHMDGSTRCYYTVRSRVLSKELPALSHLLDEILRTCPVPGERLSEIFRETRGNFRTSLQEAGHQAALTRSLSAIREKGVFLDKTGGIGFFRWLQETEGEDTQILAAKLQAAIRKLFSAKRLTVSITADPGSLAAAKKTAEEIARRLPEGEEITVRAAYPLLSGSEGFLTGGQVQYCAMSAVLPESIRRGDGRLTVLRHILNYGYLWEKIRVDGNAYGCGAQFRQDGSMSLYSFRDPQLLGTLAVFRDLPEYLRTFSADDAAMEKYIIGTISGVDTPLTPSLFGSVSMRNYLSGMPDAERMRRRAEILSADAAGIRALADPFAEAVSNMVYTVIGTESKIREAGDVFSRISAL